MKLKARIDKVAFIGWRGIDFEEVALDKGVLTAFVGPSGAGKSTLAMCLGYVLLPDKRVLNIRPISEIQDPHTAGLDPLITLINPAYGYAYTVLDITTRQSSRLIAGVHVSVKEGRAEFNRWLIQDVPKDVFLQDIMRRIDGDEEYYPNLHELKTELAGRSTYPMVLEANKSVGQYGESLHNAGVLPTDLANSGQRILYAKLIESMFRGGISSDVTAKLKEYLLPPDNRLPEVLSSVQSCTDQVLQTRRQIKESDEQLRLLDLLYGTGKEIVGNAVNRLSQNLLTEAQNASILEDKLKTSIDRQKEIATRPAQLNEEIALAEKNHKSVVDAKRVRLDLITTDVERLQREADDAKKDEDYKLGRIDTFTSALKLWHRLAGKHSSESYEWVKELFYKELGAVERKKIHTDKRIEDLLTEKARLEFQSSDIKAENLAKMLEKTTLEETFDGLSEEEALEMELSLSGITAGIVGGTPADLTDIVPTEQLPDIFWIGQEKPIALPAKSLGQWRYCEKAGGGYTVIKGSRLSTFGAKSRERRRRDIEEKIDEERTLLRALGIDKETTQKKYDELVEQKEKLHFYLNDRGALDTHLTREWTDAKAKKARKEREWKEAKNTQKELTQELTEMSKPYVEQIKQLEESIKNIITEIDALAKSIKEIEPKLAASRSVIASLTRKIEEARRILGDHYEKLTVGEFENFTEQNYLVNQTKRIGRIGLSLADEPSSRILPLEDAKAEDELSCVRLWPLINKVLRDRLPADVLDNAGEDMLSSMRKSRTGLDEKLQEQEQDMKINAHNIYGTMRQEIRAKQQQVKKLSKLGNSLQFGNITGIRVTVVIKEKLLGTLSAFSDQMSMFVKDSRPIDQVLAEFFERELDLKRSGNEDLLDYRTYIDLVLEVCRRGREWQQAASLSGGESIGCGIAVGLMLVRSLTSRGEIRGEQITPMFVIDEVQRLDDPGQKTIMEFGEREGFQAVVTALKIDPLHHCTLYGLQRITTPEERLIIRGMLMKDPAEAA